MLRFATIAARRSCATARKVISVHVDIKSPHAYLAVQPTAQLEQDYDVRVDWLPFELSYVDLGVTTSDDDLIDRTRRPPSASGDRRARMYYATAREYAKLQGLSIRGPERLLDSRLANLALLYARRQGLALPYLLAVYGAGWPSGWRDFDMEDVSGLGQVLARVGGDTSGLRAFLESAEAEAEYAEAQSVALQSGVAGVPHYSFEHAGRRRGLFGREHLALIREWLHAEGLGRGAHVRPECSHAWRPHDAETASRA